MIKLQQQILYFILSIDVYLKEVSLVFQIGSYQLHVILGLEDRDFVLLVRTISVTFVGSYWDPVDNHELGLGLRLDWLRRSHSMLLPLSQ